MRHSNISEVFRVWHHTSHLYHGVKRVTGPESFVNTEYSNFGCSRIREIRLTVACRTWNSTHYISHNIRRVFLCCHMYSYGQKHKLLRCLLWTDKAKSEHCSQNLITMLLSELERIRRHGNICYFRVFYLLRTMTNCLFCKLWSLLWNYVQLQWIWEVINKWKLQSSWRETRLLRLRFFNVCS